VTVAGSGDLTGPGEDSIDARLFAIASIAADELSRISRHISTSLLSEVPELRGDELLERLLYAGVDENLGAILHLLGLRISLDNVAAPSAAVEYARRLAQREVSVTALVRAYRIGHALFLEWFLGEVAEQEPDPRLAPVITHRILELSFGYIDRVSEQVVDAYVRERDRWQRSSTAVLVKALLARDDRDPDTTEAALGYRLRQFHLAVIGWVPEPARSGGPGDGLVRLERLGHALAIGLGCRGRPLVVPVDAALAWFWLPFGAHPNLDWAELDVIVDATDPAIRVAVGELEKGVEGFRASHHQALTAQDVALAAEPPRRVTLAERVGPIALMCRDLDAARVWVRKALGSLATDTNNNRLLRETVRVFLGTGGSYVAAAEALNLHRNTVQYRLRKAGELLPAPIADHRSDLELALRACDQLGSALLGDNESTTSVRTPRRLHSVQPRRSAVGG
jgi:PucR-like helix-turn-helix protein/diguanylate cyclase with GGDEF domain